MPEQNIYRELSKKLMMENSVILPQIWEILCTREEAELIALLPRSIEELAVKSGRDIHELEEIMAKLYHRGAVFDYVRDGVLYYRMPRQIIQFHDATILWAEAPKRLIELWVEFMDSEYPALLELVTKVKFPSFMRVIPIDKTIQSKSQVLAHEDAAEIINNAKNLAVTTCVCRKSMQKCDAPQEVCLQINKGADYTLKRGTGRKIDAAEAIAILKLSEEAGLVHLTDNRADGVNAICNCCTCCCEMLRFASHVKTAGVLAPSRFTASVQDDVCTGCGACADICPMEIISIDSGIAVIEEERCIGCGLCASVCPVDAIALIETRPRDFIPSKK